MKFIIGIAFLTMLISCGQVLLEDMSNDPLYSSAIGKNLLFRDKMLAVGVTGSRNYEPIVDYVQVVSYPGFDGPEVIFSRNISSGTTAKIVAIKGNSKYTSDGLSM